MCVWCERGGQIRIPICLHPLAEIPQKGRQRKREENEALKGEFFSL